MDKTRIVPSAGRAWDEALDNIWHDIWFGIATIAITAIAGRLIFGLPFGQVVGAAGLALAVIALLAFIYHWMRVWRHPDQNRWWAQDRADIIPTEGGQPTLALAIRPRGV